MHPRWLLDRNTTASALRTSIPFPCGLTRNSADIEDRPDGAARSKRTSTQPVATSISLRQPFASSSCSSRKRPRADAIAASDRSAIRLRAD